MKLKLNIAYVIGAMAFVLAAFAFYAHVGASTSFVTPNKTGMQESFSFFNATTTSATSTNQTGGGGFFIIAGAQQVALYFGRGDTTGQGNAGSSTYRVQVTPDGTNWYYYNTLLQNVATSTAQTTLSSIAISAATSTVVTYMQNLGGFYGVRCLVVEATDGEHTCTASAQF